MNKLPRTIGIAFNLKKKHHKGDTHLEYDEIETIEALKGELKRFGFRVTLFEQTRSFYQKLLNNRPDFVFNLAEGVGNFRSRESQVPCILESLCIPYTGSDPLSLGIALDKFLAHTLLRTGGIAVPAMCMITRMSELAFCLDRLKRVKSFIVKPRWEGSSKGIFNNSFVSNRKDLEARVAYIITHYNQPAVIEEFLENDEITVGLCGNNELRVLGMMRVAPKKHQRQPFLYSQENKREWKKKIRYDPEKAITALIREKVERAAREAFRALELRDIARIDFRLDSFHEPRIIDINPLPGLSPHYSDLPILYRLKGGTYTQLIKQILTAAFARCNIAWI